MITDLRHLARHQVMGLAAQFLLGMAVALLGQPREVTGAARVASTVFLALHVLLAVGLVIGAVMVILAARGARGRRRTLAHSGAVAIIATFVTGIITMITASSAWSFAMAAGFAVSLSLFIALLTQPVQSGDVIQNGVLAPPAAVPPGSTVSSRSSSIPGEGTTFTAGFPAAPASGPPQRGT